MPKPSYTTNFKETVNSTSASEAPLVLLEINHPNLAAPARFINDTQDLVHNGNTFVATNFRVKLPDEKMKGRPRAKVAVDNIGKELTAWLEASGGGQGATVRFIQVMRSAPNVAELDITMDFSNTAMTMLEVTGIASFDDTLNKPGVTLTYRPEVAPGIY